MIALISHIAVYMTSGSNDLNQTCTITPQWLNVNVTYVRDGFVTLEPLPQTLPDIPLTSSWLIRSAITTLENHFANSQAMLQNNIADIVSSVASHIGNSKSMYERLVTKKMVSTHHTVHTGAPSN